MSKTITKLFNVANEPVTVTFSEFHMEADIAGTPTMVPVSTTTTNNVIGEGSANAARFTLRSGTMKADFTVYHNTSAMTMGDGMMVSMVTYSFTVNGGDPQPIPMVKDKGGDNAKLTFSLDGESWVISTIDID